MLKTYIKISLKFVQKKKKKKKKISLTFKSNNPMPIKDLLISGSFGYGS